MVEVSARRFRLRALVLGLALLCTSSCGKSSDERAGAGDPDAGASGDAGDAGNAGVGGTGLGGSAPSGGAAPTGGTSSSGEGGEAGDGGLGGDSGSSTGGSAAAGGAGDGCLGGASGSAGSAGLGGSGGGGGASSHGAGNGGYGGSGGMAVTYSACQFGSGIARFVIAKRDAARDRCVVLVLTQPGSSNRLGLVLPMSLGVESAFYFTPENGECLVRGPASGSEAAESGSGTVTRETVFIFAVDVTLFFTGGVAEDLEATGLDVSSSCPF
jgi:hypothetical protein